MSSGHNYPASSAIETPSYECSTMEDEQAMQMNRGGDTSSLVPVPRKSHAPTSAPPAYAPPPSGEAPAAPYSTAQWPTDGGYAGPKQQTQGHAMMMQKPGHGHAVPGQGHHANTSVVLANPPSVGVAERPSTWQNMRVGICLALIIIKIVIIVIVVIVLLAALNSEGSKSDDPDHVDDYDEY